VSGVYWGLSALHLLGQADRLDRTSIVAWVLSCQHEGGGFGGSERHDAHLLYTLSALQILALYDELHRVDADAVARCE
jgi:geranylgeranyl transferase type-2 subunit beta